MTNDDSRLDVISYVENAPMGGLQFRVVLLCGLIAMLDGFDTQSIAFVAPALSEQWDIAAGSFGPIFGAGLFGLMVGQLIFGPAADRYGRRPIILFCTFWFGALTLATAYAKDWNTLLTLRFFTGIGLGGAMPNIIALTSEFSPAKHRATLITVMFGGFPLGAAIGGYISSKMIPALGWPSVFYLGGIIPILLLIPLFTSLPESAQHLTRSSASTSRIRKLLARVSPAASLPEDSRFYVAEKPISGFSLVALFRDGLATRTLLLWLIYFMSLLMIYFLFSWLPMILRQAGMPLEQAIFASVALNLGGIVGGILLGLLCDRFNPYVVLAGGFLVAGGCIAAIGLSAGTPAVLLMFVFAAGFAVIGGQTAMHPVSTGIYSSRVRASGLGAALAVGRIGSIVGPVAGGFLISMSWPMSALFAVGATPAIAAALGIVTLMWVVARHSRAAGASAEPATQSN